MRHLLCIPVIHDEVDLGSMGAALARRSAGLTGDRRWDQHQETTRRFWDSVVAYLWQFDPRQLRVYQDGLAAGGELGRRVIEEGARRGSRNYQAILDLLLQGAELRKTEDPALLLEEHARLRATLEGAGQRDQKDDLLRKRDRFIAETISTTLLEGQTGVLFLGGRHDPLPYLASDIDVHMVKDPLKVQQYTYELFFGGKAATLRELATYLASPVQGV